MMNEANTPRDGTLRRTMAMIVASLVGAFMLTAPASAQFGSQAGFAEAFQKDFLRRDMQLFVDYLRLEDWQRPIIEVLLDDYQITFDAGTDACKNQMSNLKEEMLADPDNAMEIALRPIKEWETEKKQMSLEFTENIRAQLSPLQMQRWPSLERAMRREKELPMGELPGERMNIFAVLHGMELKPENIQSIDPILLDYEVKLDEALTNRRNQMDRYQPKLQDAMVSKDYNAGISGLKAISVSRAGVIETHLIAIDSISRNLPSILGDEFRLKILTRGYPDIYKTNSVDRLLDSSRNLTDLTPEQSIGLDQIEGEYLVSLAESNERLLQLYRSYASDIPILEAKQSIARRNKENVERGSNVPPQISEEKKSRSNMLEGYRLRIIDLLNPEQLALIPASAKFDRRGREPGADNRPAALTPDRGRSRGGGSSGKGPPVKQPKKGKRVDGQLSPTGGPTKINDSPPKDRNDR